jgi:hypothetical protein
MEAARLRKLIAKLDTDNLHEQHAALAVIDRKVFTDIAMSLDAITDAEHRTGYPFAELIGIIQKRWPRPEAGWVGMSDTDRLCLAPGNPADAGDCEFMDAILRRAKREGVRI